jgi:hypothetical protein
MEQQETQSAYGGWVSLGWGWMRRLGSGWGGWGCGRRRCWRSVSFYLLTSPCRHSLQIGGSETVIKVTLFGEHISSWLIMFRLLWMLQKISFGILRFPWRSPSSRGIYCMTGLPTKENLVTHDRFAYLDVERSSRSNINSSPAVLLFLFRH